MERHLFLLSQQATHHMEITEQLVLQMAEAGADLIELGIPFSDPIAEGPVIQEADDSCTFRLVLQQIKCLTW